MSVVIAVKTSDKVYFAADSQVSSAQQKTNPTKSTPKCIKTQSGIIIGAAGKLVNLQIMQTLSIFQGPLTHPKLTNRIILNEIINPWFDAIRELYYEKDDTFYETNSRALIGYKNQLFYIETDGGIFSVDDSYSIGSSDDIVYPFIMDTNFPVEKRLEQALNAAEQLDPNVSSPFVYLTTDAEDEQ